MNYKVFKLKGLDYFIVGAESLGMALLLGRLNHWGVTFDDIEEVKDLTSLPTRPVQVIAPQGVDAMNMYLQILKQKDDNEQ